LALKFNKDRLLTFYFTRDPAITGDSSKQMWQLNEVQFDFKYDPETFPGAKKSGGETLVSDAPLKDIHAAQGRSFSCKNTRSIESDHTPRSQFVQFTSSAVYYWTGFWSSWMVRKGADVGFDSNYHRSRLSRVGNNRADRLFGWTSSSEDDDLRQYLEQIPGYFSLFDQIRVRSIGCRYRWHWNTSDFDFFINHMAFDILAFEIFTLISLSHYFAAIVLGALEYVADTCLIFFYLHWLPFLIGTSVL